MAIIEEEAERLSRFVANLLHMTRLEAGIEPRRDWIDSADVNLTIQNGKTYLDPALYLGMLHLRAGQYAEGVRFLAQDLAEWRLACVSSTGKILSARREIAARRS